MAYRPLFVVDEEPSPPRDSPIRGLGFLLIVLGMLRLAPAVVTGEPLDIEVEVEQPCSWLGS